MAKIDECPVKVETGTVTLEGDLCLAPTAKAVVVFAHGSGSGRRSPRNQYVARMLRDAGLATLLFDLLTPDEEEIDAGTAYLRFDIKLLATRLISATDWLKRRRETADFKVGYFGASTGAAAALVAAAARHQIIGAVVSRGGRPDLARESLPHVKAPTLLIVGGNDAPVITINQDALDKLKVEKHLAIVPGATHLFEEPGALEQVARLATDWFIKHLGQ